MLSRRVDYGMRILYELALTPNQFHSARELADQHHVPEAFLRKILQDLRRAEIVDAQKGRTGGYRLARPPKELAVAQTVEALEGPVPKLLRLVGDDCQMAEDCPTAPLWRYLEERLGQELSRLTLADVVKLAQKRRK